jgi:nuclease S1
MKRCGLLLILLAMSQSAFGWGAQGHRVVGQIAEKRLERTSPETLQRARDFLRANNNNRDCAPCDDPRTFAQVASEADDFRQDELALITRDWHFVNIDIAHETYDQARDCPNGDCVVRRIDRMVEILRDPARNNCDRETALIYLIHFMGDMHQPFHTGFGHVEGEPDRGGNSVKLSFEGRDTNLHSLWDSGIIEKQGRSDSQWVNKLMTETLGDRDPAALAAGTPVTWLNESHRKVREVHTSKKPFDEQYVKDAVPIIEERLLLAGLRLARLIEEAVKVSGSAGQ